MPAAPSVPAAVARPIQVAPIEFLPQLRSIRTYTVAISDGLPAGLPSTLIH
jgi:hypothetical protein